MPSSDSYTSMASAVSENPIITPATSAIPFGKPVWDGKPVFEPSNLNPTEDEDFNDTGDNWAPAATKSAPSPNPSGTLVQPPSTSTAQSGSSIEPLSFETGPEVEIPAYHTHFTVLDSMDQVTSHDDKVTQYLLESNRGYLFHGSTPTQEWNTLQALGGNGSEFASLPMHCIPADHLFPAYVPWVQKFAGSSEDSSVFLKSQAILTGRKLKSDHHCCATAQEVTRCEQISTTPHPHLARYLGVQTRVIGGEERVVRIAYQRYSMDLNHFVIMKRYLQPHHIPFLMQGMEKGMRHLHRLGLVHCDLRPMNVFVSIEDERDEKGHVVLKEVVIGDFDASVRIGEEVSLKRASKGWWPEDWKWGDKAGVGIDESCLDKMEKWLKEGADIWEWAGSAATSAPPDSDDALVSDIIAAMPNNGW